MYIPPVDGFMPILVASGAWIEVAIVVPADDNLVEMREGLEPVDGSLDLVDTAVIAEVAGMDEEVPVWDGGPLVRVGV